MTDNSTQSRIDGLSAQKRAVLERLLRTSSDRGSHSTPANDTERRLAEIWGAVLRLDGVEPGDSFLALGGDSISSLQVVSKAASQGMRFSSRQVIETASLRELAGLVQGTSGSEGPAVDDPVGMVGLTPIQHWFFDQDIPESHRWDQAILVELTQRVEPELVRSALSAVIAHHDVLRSRFVRVDGAWTQVVDPEVPPVELRTLTVPDWLRANLEQGVELAQRLISLADGPLVAAVLFHCADDGRDRLLLAVHHLVVDGVSMRILIEDLDLAYRSVRDLVPVRFAGRSTSFRRWSAALHAFALRDELARQLPYWLADRDRGDPFRDVDRSPGMNVAGDSRSLVADLPPEVPRRLLREVPRHGSFTVQDVLLAALLLAWQREQAVETLTVDLEGHGREAISESVDVSRTVGWFTSIFPLHLTAPAGDDALESLREVAATLDQVPISGIGYGVLRYLAPQGEQLRSRPPSVSFNYLGRFDGPSDNRAVFGVPVEVPTVLLSDEATRPHVIDVMVTAVGERVIVQWDYASRLVPADTVAALVAAYVAAIAELVEAVVSTPHTSRGSEFELARINAGELNSIQARLKRRRSS